MKWFPLSIALILSVLFCQAPVQAHQVDTVEFEFQKLDKVWRLHGEMDIAYMLPETRGVPGGLPLSRKAVMRAAPEELARIRKETEATLRKFLEIHYAGKSVPWRIEFPDFAKKPLVLPEDYGDIALLTVRLVVDARKDPGELSVHWSSKEKAELIILTGGDANAEVVSVSPGGSLTLLRVKGPAKPAAGSKPKPSTAAKDQDKGTVELLDQNVLWSWVASGFRHVLPLGFDHMLFIFGLFLAVLKWKPMLWQSLLFTVSHSITLAICALGWVSLDSRWVEIFIAFSIAFIGIEDLCRCKVGMRRYVLVFIFGLVHGMGFANVLADKVKGIPKDQLTVPLLGFNLGVELAQLTVILIASILFVLLGKKHQKTGQLIGGLIVTAAGLAWMAQRIFFT